MKKLIIVAVVFTLILTVTIVTSDTIVRYPQLPQMERTTLGYSPNITEGHPSVCQMTNGSYALVYGAGSGISIRLSSTPDAFPASASSIIPTHRQPDIQCWNNSLWIALSNRNDGTIELWNCSEADDVTSSGNWNKVSTPCDDDSAVINPIFGGTDPIDCSLYMFDEPVNGHQFWLECLDRNGTGESNDCDRYIFYSDDPTQDDWRIGNGGAPVIRSYVLGQGNWPLDGLYIPEAEAWIIFNSEEINESTSKNMSSVYYAWTNNINTTWNTTWITVVPRDVNESTPIDNFMVVAPDIIRVDDKIYCYYQYLAEGQSSNGNCKIAGVTTFNLSAFIDPDFEFQDITGAKNNGNFPIGSQFQFNFTNATGATCYQIQVSNASDFSTTFINETINATSDIMSDPGGSFTYKGDYVEINLPFSYNLTYSGTHYLRVRPGYHAV